MLCSFSTSLREISYRYLVNSSASFCCSFVKRVILVERSCFSLTTCSFSSFSFFSWDEKLRENSFWNFSFSSCSLSEKFWSLC